MFLILMLFMICYPYVAISGQNIYNNRTLAEQIKVKKITINLTDSNLDKILLAISKQANIKYGFRSNVNVDLQKKMTLNVTNVTIEEALNSLLKDSNYDYLIDNNEIVIINRIVKPQTNTAANKFITGKVLDGTSPIVGATVILLKVSSGAISDDKGMFKINAKIGDEIEISCVGYKSKTMTVDSDNLIIKLEADVLKVEDVVVSGYFQKSKQSITGSEVMVTGENLRQVGSLNFMQAISVFDPSVRMLQNNEYGSDPNRVPEITIRGENGFDLRGSADADRSNPNSPLYILDGIEVSATRVYDLDMNRIEAMSILKDASATALYGSRGANGVILIQTIKPREGELKVSFNANYNISAPDLRDYNLMNSREKLLYEKEAGEYTAAWMTGATQDELDYRYNYRLSEIARGVDTYWLSSPLRTSVNQRYNVFIEGGGEVFRYGVDLKYDNDKGVMKGSGRDKFGININFSYNLNNKFIVTNDLTVNDVKGTNSPYGSFSQFSLQNPYERIYDAKTGELVRRFMFADANRGVNPMINAMLPNTDYNKYTEIQDNISLDWQISERFKVVGRFGLTKKLGTSEIYRSPYSTDFDSKTDIKDKGSYSSTKSNDINIDGNITAAYNTIFAEKFTLNFGVGSNVRTINSVSDGYIATGFLNDNMNFVQYAQKYKEGSVPNGTFDVMRMIGFFSNVNVGYDNRYFLDASFRTDGSSRFGRDSRFAPFWSVGGAWNLNNEKWWTGEGTMKLRGSVGSTGSVNFSADQAITKYRYSAENEYNGYYGATLLGYGNSSLKWQNTLQYNLGLDLNVFKNLLNLNVDAYIKQTQNLLLPIDVAPSTGFLKYTENMGAMQNSGIDLRARFNIIRKYSQGITWSVTLAASTNKNKITKLSNALLAMNEEALKLENSGYNPNPKEGETSGTLRPLRVYESGRSQSALMVVRSMGIDPATGNEVYVKLNGDLTFDYDPRDKVIVGDTNPKLQGNFQSNFDYKGFNLFLVFSYEFGADVYNSTLAAKVDGADPRDNADKRVLYDRWKRKGDVAMFRHIADRSPVYQSTRLVQDNDFINLQTLSLSYTMPKKYLEKTSLERMKITFTTTDLFRISTIKQERGTSYPFAKSFTIGVNLTF